MAVRVSAGLAAIALLGLLAGPALSQTLQPLGFAGRWAMNASRSHFAEDVTGPAPASAELDITKDDGAALAWTLVERDGLSVAASEFGDTPLNGSAARIVVDGAFAPVTATRTGPHVVELVSTLGNGASQTIELKLVSANAMAINEKLISPSGKAVSQHLEFDRAKD